MQPPRPMNNKPYFFRAFLVAQIVKNLPTMQETWVWPLDWEDPLEKGTATYSSILAWRIPWTEEPGSLQWAWQPTELWKNKVWKNQPCFFKVLSCCGSWGRKESDTTERLIWSDLIMIVAEVHPAIIIRTTRVSPATSLALIREMSVGSAQVSAPGILSW